MFSREDYERAAKTLDVPEIHVEAVTAVESSGETFWHLGSREVVPIRFEAHVFGQRTGYVFNKSHPELSSYEWNPSLAAKTHAGALSQLERARLLAYTAANESTSWGAFQIMGYWWKDLGYVSSQEFVDNMSARGDDGQMDAFVKLMLYDERLQRALRAGDWATFERIYNGNGFGGLYAQRIRDWLSLRRQDGTLQPRALRKGCSGVDVKALQTALHLPQVDGDFGVLTEIALKAFQRRNGLLADGVAGSKTKAVLGL